MVLHVNVEDHDMCEEQLEEFLEGLLNRLASRGNTFTVTSMEIEDPDDPFPGYIIDINSCPLDAAFPKGVA